MKPTPIAVTGIGCRLPGTFALEDAGYPLKKVARTRMGVFTGASSHDYYDIQDVDSLTTDSVTGWAMCMTSTRISYDSPV